MLVALAIGFCVYAVFAVLRWRTALIWFLAVLPMLPGLQALPQMPTLSIYRLLLIPILFGWFLAPARRPIGPIVRRITIVIAVWVAANIASSITSVDMSGSLKRTLTLLEYVPLLYMFGSLESNPVLALRVRLALVVGLFMVIAYALVETVTGANPFFDAGWFSPVLLEQDYVRLHMRAGTTRIAGPMGQPINLGLYLGMIVPPAAVIIWQEFGRMKWIALGVVIPLSLWFEFRTFSRGPWIGAVAACVAAALVWSWRRRRVLVAVRTLGAVLAFAWVAITFAPPDLMAFVNQSLGTASYDQDPNISSRFETLGLTADILKERPVFGLGPGVVFHDMMDPGEGVLARYGGISLENQYVYVALDTGLVGLAAYLLLMLHFGQRALRRTKLTHGTASAAYGTALFAAWVAFMVTASTVQVAGFQTMMLASLMGQAYGSPSWQTSFARKASSVKLRRQVSLAEGP